MLSSVGRFCLSLLIFALILSSSLLGANESPTAVALTKAYESSVHSLLQRYCFDCHSGDLIEADLDLSLFKTTAEIRLHTKSWVSVRRLLENREMPPKDSAQPTDAERAVLQKWVRNFLLNEAKTQAGDPGPVALRRLSNAEYTYTIRDLTAVDSLDPANEFPVDGAAGEGFANVGSGQGMSPALVQKYLEAGKKIADHAVLTPNGIRFSPHTTSRDHVDVLLASIREFYGQFTVSGGGVTVNLDGRPFKTNQDGRLPVEAYLKATLAERTAIQSGTNSLDSVATERGLSPKYLRALWDVLTNEDREQSLLLDDLRRQWKASDEADLAKLVAKIEDWQGPLWKFYPIGQIGRDGGPGVWMEPVSPMTSRQELRLKLPESPTGVDVDLFLTANDLGDGHESDFVVWQQPRFEFRADESGFAPPPILLRDVQTISQNIEDLIRTETPRTEQYLTAVAASWIDSKSLTLPEIQGDLNPKLLESWASIIGLGNRANRKIKGLFTAKQTKLHGYDAINGWGNGLGSSLLTNQSAEAITFLTLTIPPRSVVVHPSPTIESIVSWKSPVGGKFQIEGLVADADDKCGNGAGWRLESLSEIGRAVLASGKIDNGGREPIRLESPLQIAIGDVVSLVVNARDGSHVCDTTHLELKLSEIGGEKRVWNLASDVVDNILSGNPLPDSYDNKETWHFCASENQSPSESQILPGSALADWRVKLVKAKDLKGVEALTKSVQSLLTTDSISGLGETDKKLRERLLNWQGPLRWTSVGGAAKPAKDSIYGLAATKFGQHPNGTSIDPASLCVQAPTVLKVRLPAKLVSGAEFVASGMLHQATGKNGTVQLQATTSLPEVSSVLSGTPILVGDDESTNQSTEAAVTEFRNLFPPALCYSKIVPVDEVVTLTLYHREDRHLQRLMLNEAQSAELDRLWDELFFVAQEPIALTVAFEQISEFATQDRPDLVTAFSPLKKPINDRADLFRKRLVATEPIHLDAALEIANEAWRRPLSETEKQELRNLYQELRENELAHDAAICLVLARVFTSPSFLYKLEQPAAGGQSAPVEDLELATRLSYFLWSSQPDDELRQLAESGRLTEPAMLQKQTDRMLDDPRTRRMAIQFACQWLHMRDFDKNDDKNEKLYPEFAAMRGEMYEETVRFFEEMFRSDGSILGVLNADHTYLNAALAKHYGIEGVDSEWQRVEGMQQLGRGGVLGMATFLASQSGASRTSPILRGNWIYETLLGERLPRPPANVPILPEALPNGLTARQLIELHSSAPGCAKCHVKIDHYGFVLEQFDAIGRRRPQPVDTKSTLPNGDLIEGLDGLRDYLLNVRRDDFVRQFCRKLVGYALGREVQLSDEILLTEMQRQLKANDYRFSIAVKAIVHSQQFQNIRPSSRVVSDD